MCEGEAHKPEEDSCRLSDASDSLKDVEEGSHTSAACDGDRKASEFEYTDPAATTKEQLDAPGPPDAAEEVRGLSLGSDAEVPRKLDRSEEGQLPVEASGGGDAEADISVDSEGKVDEVRQEVLAHPSGTDEEEKIEAAQGFASASDPAHATEVLQEDRGLSASVMMEEGDLAAEGGVTALGMAEEDAEATAVIGVASGENRKDVEGPLVPRTSNEQGLSEQEEITSITSAGEAPTVPEVQETMQRRKLFSH